LGNHFGFGNHHCAPETIRTGMNFAIAQPVTQGAMYKALKRHGASK
jgi:hypothetical protein